MNQIWTTVALVLAFALGYAFLGPPSGRALVIGTVIGMVAVLAVRWVRTKGR
jgi:hypothetical protein